MIAHLHSDLKTTSAPAPHAPVGRIIVVFRNDDPSAISDVEHERRICAMFERHGVPQTIGVIPNVALGPHRDPNATGERALDSHPELVALLRKHCDAVGSEIALHGYTHRTSPISLPERREYFEFRDEGFELQARKLARGVAMIESSLGVSPTTFIPPWNRLDRDTVTACGQCRLSVVSAGAHAPTSPWVASLGTDCDLFNFPAFLEQALATDHRVFLRILFHSCTTRTPEELAALERALELCSAPQCRVMTIAQAAREFPVEIATVNEAGRNVLAQDMLHGSNRAAADFCRRGAKALRRNDSLGALLEQSERLYRAGKYGESAAMGVEIDRAAFKLVMQWFALLIGIGFLAGLTMNAALWAAGGIFRLVTWAAMAGVTAGLAEWLRRKGTAPDTRRMLRVSGWAAILGLNAAFVVAELVRDALTF